MMKKCRLALLAGGVSSEREVSLNSGDQVFAALDKEKYDIIRYDPKTDLGRLVADASKIDAALIVLHGPYGEDGTVQGLMELLSIPYQGSGVLGSALAMNKVASKQMYEKNGVPSPAYLAFTSAAEVDPDRCVEQLGLPLVVKPSAAGSSVGLSIVRSRTDIVPAVEKAFLHDAAVVMEAYITGTELTVGVIGNDDLTALPIIEIIPDEHHEFFDYEAKYTAGVTREICPARISASAARKAQDYAIKSHRALFCDGYSRSDMILSGDAVFVLETNTIPGMTATSLLPQAAKVAGMSFTVLLDRLIELGIERFQKKGDV